MLYLPFLKASLQLALGLAEGTLSKPDTRGQEAYVKAAGGRPSGTAPELGRDRSEPSKHGETLSATPLPALPVTRARPAHDHFRMQGQQRAEEEPGRGAHVSSRRSAQAGESCPAKPGTPTLSSLHGKTPSPLINRGHRKTNFS